MKVLKFSFVFILLVALVVGGLYFYSDSILQKSVTTVGPKLLGVPVTLEKTSLNATGGAFEINSLTIHNPESYESEYAFHIDRFLVKLAPTSLMSNAIHIQDITVDNAIIISDGLRADNHREIISNLTNKIPNKNEDPKSKGEKDEKAPEKNKSGKKLIIDHFSLKGSQLIIQVDGEVITKVDFPEIELREIGSKGAAVSATEAATQIYTAIASETSKVLTVNQDVIEALANAKLKKLGINDLNDLKNPEKLLKDPDAVNSILNSLLGPKE